jgi:DNA-entry nuclease
MNVEGMETFEDEVAQYVNSTDHHVLYRATPIFEGENLLASGVLIEAQSVEDSVLQLCVYCYNVQPCVTIDYATGDSSGPEFTGSADTQDDQVTRQADNQQENSPAPAPSTDNVLNTNTMKFYKPTCGSVSTISPHNRQDFHMSRDEQPCKRCNP